MFGPACSTVRAFRVSLHEIILLVRAGDVPHFPFSVMEDEVRFVDASVFPVFLRSKGGLALVGPLIASPFEKSNRVGAPEVLGGARIVDAFDPRAPGWVPSFYVGRAVAPAVATQGWLSVRAASGTSSPVASREIVQPVAESGAREGSDALKRSVAPYP